MGSKSEPVSECIASRFAHLVDLLRHRALHQPQKWAYMWLRDGEEEAGKLTYGDLDYRSQLMGAHLQASGLTGERVLLLFPSSLEFIEAFFSCLYAGAVAVPAYPPRNRRQLPRLRAIVRDADAATILTTAAFVPKIRAMLGGDDAPGVPILATDAFVDHEANEWYMPHIDGNTLAFLQYTSGSTASPRGVMVSHGNILRNEEMICSAFRHEAGDVAVGWLPLFHDMGLIGNVLQPLYADLQLVLMSPEAFLQKPVRWLRAISKYRAKASGGPNFAYELCLRKIPLEERSAVDLSSWRIAFTGAELIRASTLDEFCEAFAASGFRREAFLPCYGLAEATLMVSGGPAHASPAIFSVDKKDLARHRVTTAVDGHRIVGCGNSIRGTEVAIVDRRTLSRCPPGHIGEIWVAGTHVAGGYWNKPEATQETFRAYLADTREGPFLRTGDLGFLRDGELVVTGRDKDLIVIRGRNIYPQDIEFTVEHSHPSARPGGGVAFTVQVETGEALVIAQELEPRHTRNLEEMFRSICRAVADEHEIQPSRIILVKAGGIPKTSSGKIQRQATRLQYLGGMLEALGEWRDDSETTQVGQTELSTQGRDYERSEPRIEEAPSVAAISGWLVSQVARRFGIARSAIDVYKPFTSYGLGSVEAVQLAAGLEAWIGCAVPPTLAWDYPSIDAAARYLGNDTAVRSTLNTDQVIQQCEPVAIIGLACRFPRAPDGSAFWNLLRGGTDAVSSIPSDRWDVSAYYDPKPGITGKMYTRSGAFLEHIDRFDSDFFDISPREADEMDPQQRLLLEVTWEALEDAGQAPGDLAGTQAGVFIGISSSDYYLSRFGNPAQNTAHSGTGNAFSVAANRISYFLGLRGPSMALDTACSSSLVAVDSACESLRSRRCGMAVAGGVNLILSPHLNIAFCQARMMSIQGRCKTFDAEADGYVRGEGCGIIILKRLADAVACGDRVLAIVRGSAVNQDGCSNGLTAPNGTAQREVIRQALAASGVKPSQVDYLEAHGTGTPLGDPIEFHALASEYGRERPQERPLFVGSVKTNIGHLEAAAGIAGLIKTVLALRNREIPPHLHLKQLNPRIAIDDTPIAVPGQCVPWHKENGSRFAGVSSFGFGGTNAHVVLEEAPADRPVFNEVERPYQLLAISAKSEPALRELAGRFEAHLAHHPETPLGDTCFAANTGRCHFIHRFAVAANSVQQLRGQLADLAAGRLESNLCSAGGTVSRPKVAFLFTGQGAQYPGMGRGLYETQPTFRDALDRCDEILRPYLDRQLLSILYPEAEDRTLINETAYTQPSLFALEYALAELWRSWGVEPDTVLGHSIGEYVAACVAGVFTLEEGLELIAQRSRLMQALPKEGEMAAILADSARVATVVSVAAGRVNIAAVNGPENTVISGDRAAVGEVLEHLSAEGIEARPLSVSHAFHSPLMEPMLDAFDEVVRRVKFNAPSVPLIANLTGEVFEPGEVPDATYWRRHIREAVQFKRGMEVASRLGCDLFLELGPHPVLLGVGKQCLPSQAVRWLPSLRRGQPDWSVLLDSLGELYVRGVDIDWRGVDKDYNRRRVSLPTYPFQREQHWFKASEPTQFLGPARKTNTQVKAPSRLLGHRLTSPLPMYEASIDASSLPYLRACWVGDQAVLPAGVYVEMVLAATSDALGSGVCMLTDLSFPQRLIVSDEKPTVLQLVMKPRAPGQDTEFQIFSRNDGAGSWTLHADGQVRVSCGGAAPFAFARTEIQARCEREVEPSEQYGVLAEKGLDYGDSLRGITQLWQTEREVLARVQLATSLQGQAAAYQIHPTLLEAGFQLLAGLASSDTATRVRGGAHLPTSVRDMRWYRQPGPELWAYAQLAPLSGTVEAAQGDVYLFDDEGKVIAELQGVRLECADEDLAAPLQENIGDWFYELGWQADRNAQSGHQVPAVSPDQPGTWLIFEDGVGVGGALAHGLKARGEPCVLARPGRAYERQGSDDLFHIDPTRQEDFERLLEETVRAGHPPLRGMVHLWSLDSAPPDETSVASLEADTTLSCGSALYLVQALIRIYGRVGRQSLPAPRLWFVTRGAQPVDGTVPRLAVAQAPLWGLGRVVATEVPLEYPGLWGGLVDLDPAAPVDDVDDLLETVLGPNKEDQVAFRQGRRHVVRLARSNSLATAVEKPFRCRSDGSYLVTGGLGGLGLHVAHWLVQCGARRMLLVGRSKLPPRREWDSVSQDNEAWRKISGIRALEALGADVDTASIDVSDRAQLAAFIGRYRELKAPPIRGVVHAAGVNLHRTLLQAKLADVTAILRPKVTAGWILHELFYEEPLDFFVLFSSIASIVGSALQGTYAAANAFLDSLAHYRRTSGASALAVDWGPWFTVGMAGSQTVQQSLNQLGLRGFSPDEGCQGLELLLGREAPPQVTVAKFDWPTYKPRFEVAGKRAFLDLMDEEASKVGRAAGESNASARRDRVGAATAEPALLTQLDEAPAEQHHKLIVAYLQSEIAKVLGFDAMHRIEPTTGFFEIGMDSIMALEVIRHMEASLGKRFDIALSVIFKYPTIDSLAGYLADRLKGVGISEGHGIGELAPIRREPHRATLTSTGDLVVSRETRDKLEAAR